MAAWSFLSYHSCLRNISFLWVLWTKRSRKYKNSLFKLQTQLQQSTEWIFVLLLSLCFVQLRWFGSFSTVLCGSIWEIWIWTLCEKTPAARCRLKFWNRTTLQPIGLNQRLVNTSWFSGPKCIMKTEKQHESSAAGDCGCTFINLPLLSRLYPRLWDYCYWSSSSSANVGIGVIIKKWLNRGNSTLTRYFLCRNDSRKSWDLWTCTTTQPDTHEVGHRLSLHLTFHFIS